MINEKVRKVVVLGGGTSGWMTACYLLEAVPGIEIEVLEAPSIGRIGVGEATVPNLQKVFFDYLGISEREWMTQCNASFKMAVRFVNWTTEGPAAALPRRTPEGRDDVFYHPFGILPSHDNLPLSHYWLAERRAGRTNMPYHYACFVEPWVMDAGLAPHTREGERVVNYAWHLDALLLADFLQRWAVERGAIHTLARMTEALVDERGHITGLVTDTAGTVSGDLFVDCSGFRGALVNQALGEPFLDQSDYLLCDSAIATATPYPEGERQCDPYTSAIAMDAGWTWRIALLGRFGTGYVYSSRHTDDDTALRDFCGLWGLDPEGTFNRIRFRVGRNRRAWVGNCVSIGLASCFLEPLESSGLYFTYAAIYQLAKHFPSRRFEPALRDSFNEEIAAMFDETRDFIQAHFYFSPRHDTEFWRDNKQLTLPDDLRAKIERYRVGLPVNVPVADETSYYGNFEAEFRNFWTNGSYYAVLAGLGLEPPDLLPRLAHTDGRKIGAEERFAALARRRDELLASLPPVEDYLREFHGR
jgi:hypothetical protein